MPRKAIVGGQLKLHIAQIIRRRISHLDLLSREENFATVGPKHLERCTDRERALALVLDFRELGVVHPNQRSTGVDVGRLPLERRGVCEKTGQRNPSHPTIRGVIDAVFITCVVGSPFDGVNRTSINRLAAIGLHDIDGLGFKCDGQKNQHREHCKGAKKWLHR